MVWMVMEALYILVLDAFTEETLYVVGSSMRDIRVIGVLARMIERGKKAYMN
jgi:aminoglycoside/choline kinase family phosphotransferase